MFKFNTGFTFEEIKMFWEERGEGYGIRCY